MINRAKLLQGLKKSASLSYRDASVCVDFFLDAMAESISRGERIELRGFGSFEVKQVLARKHPSLLSGKTTIPTHGRIVFRPCQKLRDSAWNIFEEKDG
jgi:integration host factor subunit beta